LGIRRWPHDFGCCSTIPGKFLDSLSGLPIRLRLTGREPKAPRGNAVEPTSPLSVRIAVAVDDEGRWSVAGNCGYEGDEEAMQAAFDELPQDSSPTRHLVWVTAEIPSFAVRIGADESRSM